MKRDEILALAKRDRECDEVLFGVQSAYIIPNRRKHDSGWECMTIICTFKELSKVPVRFSQTTDDIAFYGGHFRMDCCYPSGIIHIWNSSRTFKVNGWSSVNFEEEEKK